MSVVDQHGAQIHRVKRFGVRRYEPKLLETQARIDPLDPELQQAKQVGNFSRGSRSPHADDLFGSIDPQAGEPQRPRAQPSRLQNTGKIPQQIAHHLLNRLSGNDRLEQPAFNARNLGILAGRDRLRYGTQRLIEPNDRWQPEAPGEWSPSHGQEICNRIEAEASTRTERGGRKPQGGNRQRR
ncbi:hypothetical protein SAQ01S_08380 [Sphingomonas aquatilis NBRC 16722]|nr:hypothetical protein SAQ01S_08380 [Sphingomonas aquatilis NBRC 16722]